MSNIGLYEWTVVLIGMGTVFIALIGLSLILGGFSVVANRLAGRKPDAAGAAGQPASAPTPPETRPAASAAGVTPEVVAAITAALAAATGRRASEVRIARISPSQPGPAGLNTPVWGYANRLAAGRR